MTPPLKPIDPKTTRWEPTADPSAIVVPGLDTMASVNDQIDQIEQLITIKLQNIDANFSKLQQVMANRILPAVKRYSVGTEPVREAAKFWTTFFEQAAQMRVPTEEDLVEPSEGESESAQETSEDQSESNFSPSTPDQSFNPDTVGSENSFNPAVMSTPATARHKSQYSIAPPEDDTTSWNASLESPLVRLDREIQSLTRDDDISVASSSAHQLVDYYDESLDITQRQILPDAPQPPSVSKGKARAAPEPLLKGVLKRNTDGSAISPLKVKARPFEPQIFKPHLPPDVGDSSDHIGSTPVRRSTRKPRSTKRSASKPVRDDFYTDDDSFDQKLGMSPPITMAFAKLPKTKTPKLGRTPRKEAAQRITNNLLTHEKRTGLGSARLESIYTAGISKGVESSLSTVPTPPSLSRYARHGNPSDISSSLADASLESMMRRVGLSVHGFESQYGVEDTARKANSTISSSAAPSIPSSHGYGAWEGGSGASSATPQIDEAALEAKYNLARVRDDDDDFNPVADDSSDSIEYDDEAPMMLAPPQNDFDDDDSFSDDSFDDGDGGAEDMDNPFAEGAQDDGGDAFEDEDDSFDDPADQDGEEETLFGVPPAQRLAVDAQRRVSEANFRMFGGQLLEDTLGIGAQMARAGRVEETPTPWPGGGAGR
ncbi:hypothetical protein BDW22DRAFT_1349945 [Trametopsis cervina]|nr:hypothetical protein BDW22DRAFT_1349945 [Trametopsis cervina]